MSSIRALIATAALAVADAVRAIGEELRLTVAADAYEAGRLSACLDMDSGEPARQTMMAVACCAHDSRPPIGLEAAPAPDT